MKLPALIAIVLALGVSSCKLEPLSANPNSNAPKPSPATASASTASGDQSSQCSLTKSVAPIAEGLKLGMTPDEVLATLPGSKDDAEVKSGLAKPPSPLGVSDFAVHTGNLQPKEKFTNIDHFSFSLLDGHVTSINIGYHGPEYANVDQFVSKIVAGTSLPPADQWQTQVGMDNLKILTCKDFEVRVFAGGKGGNLNYILVTDLAAAKTVKERRAKAKAAASPATQD
jgi:hypothetical protein